MEGVMGVDVGVGMEVAAGAVGADVVAGVAGAEVAAGAEMAAGWVLRKRSNSSSSSSSRIPHTSCIRQLQPQATVTQPVCVVCMLHGPLLTAVLQS
jgi:hypothetical protein